MLGLKVVDGSLNEGTALEKAKKIIKKLTSGTYFGRLNLLDALCLRVCKICHTFLNTTSIES